MTDSQQTHPKLNPYFRDPRIRKFLIKNGLINRFGDILRPSHSDAALAQSLKKRRIKKDPPRDAIDQTGDENVRVRPQTAHPNRRARQFHRSISRSLVTVRRSLSPTNDKDSPKRAKSARYKSSGDFGNRLVRRSLKAKSPQKKLCRVIMTYLGPQTVIEYDKRPFQQQGDEIVVMQQHCGGENLTVFKGLVKPREKFAFDSQRHIDYPFALALYINNLIDCRVSVCCEYKHRKNVPLGGPSGSFAISEVQKVNLCRSCRYIQLKKKSKDKIALGPESSRYRKSVVLQKPPRDRSHSPVPSPRAISPPTSSTRRSRSPDVRRTPSPPPKPPQHRTPSPPPKPPQHRTPSPPPKPPQHRTPSPPPKPPQRRTPTTRGEADEKKPFTSSNKHRSSAVQSPSVSRTPTPRGEADEKKPATSSNAHSSSVVRTAQKPRIQSPSVSERTISSTDEDTKKSTIASLIRDVPIIPTSRGISSESSNTSRTSTPPRASVSASDADDKKPPISSAKRYSPVVLSDHKNPVSSQNNTNGNNYESDFDESDDDDHHHQQTHSRFGKPRISDANSIDKDEEGDKNQPKHSLNTSSSADFFGDQVNQPSSNIFTRKEKTNGYSRKSSSSSSRKSGLSGGEGHNRFTQVSSGKNNMVGNSRRSSSSTLRKSGPSEDEDDQHTPRVLNGGKNIDDDAPSSSSRRSGPLPDEKSNHNRFPLTTNTSKKENGGDRRRSSGSSDDFFGIKRSSTKEKSKGTPGISSDWFETNSRNDQDDNDPFNFQSPPKTKSRERNLFSDDEK